MSGAVVYPTKVRIFLQITTISLLSIRSKRLLFTLQRYEFFCKSQRLSIRRLSRKRCCLPYKGTNFSANHNTPRSFYRDLLAVVYPTKVRIFLQITTHNELGKDVKGLLFTLQRYEFFCKSQRYEIQPI